MVQKEWHRYLRLKWIQIFWNDISESWTCKKRWMRSHLPHGRTPKYALLSLSYLVQRVFKPSNERFVKVVFRESSSFGQQQLCFLLVVFLESHLPQFAEAVRDQVEFSQDGSLGVDHPLLERDFHQSQKIEKGKELLTRRYLLAFSKSLSALQTIPFRYMNNALLKEEDQTRLLLTFWSL